jgi:hypothetical protein
LSPALPLRSRAAMSVWRVLFRSGLGPDGPFRAVWWLPRLRWERARRRRPGDVQRFEATRFSQNGEDGILAEILRRLDVAGGVAVEIGASDGAENCTRALVEDGWRAVWLEADPEAAARATVALAGRGSMVQAWVTAENVCGLLDGAGVPDEPEVLVIDLDGNDFYVLDALLRRRRPHVVVIEYNALAGPSWWVQPYDPERTWDHTAWHGAGLNALTWLCNRYGLSLVGCDSTGVNAFFVRGDRSAAFNAAGPRDHYMPPSIRLPFGHPWRPRAATPPLEADAITLRAPRQWLVGGGRAYLPVVVGNRSRYEAHGFGVERQVSIATRWTGDEGEPRRCRESFAVRPGGRTLVVLRVDIPEGDGLHHLNLLTVQEGVRWFGEGSQATVELRRR